MEIRSTTDEDLDVFVDAVHSAFGRFRETPVDVGGLRWSALEIDRHLLAPTEDGRPVGTADPYGGPGKGSIEVLRRADCGQEVHDGYRRARPGALARPHRWWALRAGQPPVSRGPRHVAVHRDADCVPDGYAGHSLGDGGTLTVDETVAAGDTVSTAPARFLLGHDLGSVHVGGTTSEHPRACRTHTGPPSRGGRSRDALFRAERTPHCLHWI
ncbi:hypothetical protein [Streptomyces fructofermentans]|uniref:hypothetical protein n=1 Tax=Streptomyces fructofermentans TaxID=152141 RepID=UPI003F4D5D7F